jgi:hypothetical protein
MWYNEAMTTLAADWTKRFFRTARARVKSRVAFGGDDNRPVEVYRAANEIEAALVVALLDSEGIHAITSGESLGSVYGMQFGPLAEVKVLVKKTLAPRAVQIIEERHLGMEAGELVDEWWKDEDWEEDDGPDDE